MPKLKNTFFIFLFITFFVSSSCDEYRADNDILKMAASYIEFHLKSHPVLASSLGDTRFDDMLDDWDSTSVETRIRKLTEFQNSVNKIDTTHLSPDRKIDYHIIRTEIASELWELNTNNTYQQDPAVYNSIIKDAIPSILNRDTLTAKNCSDLLVRLNQLPLLFGQMKTNLQQPRRTKLQSAITELVSIKYLMTSEIQRIAYRFPQYHDSLYSSRRVLLDSLNGLSRYLENQLLPRTVSHRQIGANQLTQILKYRYNILQPVKIISSRIEREYQWCVEEITKTAVDLNKQLFKRRQNDVRLARNATEQVVEKIYNNYLQDEMLIGTVRNIITDINRFLTARDLFDVPVDLDIQIKRTPQWDDSPELVTISAPGPFGSGNNYVFSLKQLPENQTWYEQISFLKKLNAPMLQVLTIYNITPGKIYLLSKINAQESTLRKTFVNQAYFEGWPIFCGFLMVDTCYGGFDKKIKLLHLLQYLRVILAANIDIKYHCGELGETAALNMLMTDGLLNLEQAQYRLAAITQQPAKHIVPFFGYTQLNNTYKSIQAIQRNYFSRTEFLTKLINEGAVPLTHVLKKFRHNFLTQP